MHQRDFELLISIFLNIIEIVQKLLSLFYGEDLYSESSKISRFSISQSISLSNSPVLINSGSQSASEPIADIGADESLKLAELEVYPSFVVQLGRKNRDWLLGAGMVNLGNTCFLNSSLQALFHVPALVNWLISYKEPFNHCQDLDSLCTICAMRMTLVDSKQSTATQICPRLIYNRLQLVCKNFLPGRQEDAHEFLRYLIDDMENAYISRFKDFSVLDSGIKESSPLTQIFGGYLRSDIRCLKCGHVSTTFQHFMDLLLDIRKAQTLDEALKQYFSTEKLDVESYLCDSCQQKVQATKQFSLEKAPMVLCIQLKRFSVKNEKITKHVMFRERLDLLRYSSQHPNASSLFRLVAVVSHTGSTVSSGHYYTIAQTPAGNFYLFDDNLVRPVSHQIVFSSSAYIMFYELESSHTQSACPVLTSAPPDCKTPQHQKNGQDSFASDHFFKIPQDGLSATSQ